MRRHLAASGEVEPPTTLADRDLIERHVERVIIKPEALEVCLIPPCEASGQAEDPIVDELALLGRLSWERLDGSDVGVRETFTASCPEA